eukprot:4699501-Ditylum_brightwellii.AAC.1
MSGMITTVANITNKFRFRGKAESHEGTSSSRLPHQKIYALPEIPTALPPPGSPAGPSLPQVPPENEKGAACRTTNEQHNDANNNNNSM